MAQSRFWWKPVLQGVRWRQRYRGKNNGWMVGMLEDLAKEATHKYFFGGKEPGAFRVHPTSNGSNNWVYYVDVGDDRYVLRLYNNGRSKTRVIAEHCILEALAQCPAARTFATPRLKQICREPHLPGASDDGLSTYIELSDGSYACFFDLLPGVYVGGKSNFMHSMGKVTSELMAVLQNLYDECDTNDISREDGSANDSENAITATAAALTRYTYEHGPAPYFDLWRVHSAITRDSFFDFCETSTQLKPYSTEMKMVLSGITELEQQILKWKQEYDFPRSFVHGDLVTDNFLCDEQQEMVTAVLDFEFVGVDWRIMELATCISKFPEEEHPMSNLKLFIGGFRQANLVALDKLEVEALPLMIKVRVLSNVIYFVGRAISGEAALTQLTERIEGYCRRLIWLDNERNRADLFSLFDL